MKRALPGMTVPRLFEGVGVGTGVRLLGISVSGLGPAGPRQLTLDELFERQPGGAEHSATVAAPPSRPDAWADAEKAMDAIRGRFGEDAIGPAVLASGEGVEVLRRRGNPWGPLADPSEKSSRSQPAAGRQGRGED